MKPLIWLPGSLVPKEVWERSIAMRASDIVDPAAALGHAHGPAHEHTN